MQDFWATIQPALLVFIQVVALALLTQATIYVKRRWTTEQIGQAVDIADKAVASVEMMASVWGWDPEVKKRQALDQVNLVGARFGIHLTEDQWETLIEAAVKQMRDIRTELKKPIEAGASPGGS